MCVVYVSELSEKAEEITVHFNHTCYQTCFFFLLLFFFWSQFGDEGVSSVFCVVLAWTCLQSHFAIVRNKSLLSVLRLMSLKYQTVGTSSSNCRKKIVWYKLKRVWITAVRPSAQSLSGFLATFIFLSHLLKSDMNFMTCETV